MVILLTIVHVFVCLFLVIVVLLQSGKAADLAGAFGGMGSQTAFGPRGSATALSRATTVAAALFMVTSLTLAILASRTGSTSGAGRSVLESTKTPQPAKPAVPPGFPAAPPDAKGSAQVPAPNVKVGEGPVKKGQPSVTLSDPATGASTTLPLEITPGGKPANPAQQPPSQPPAKPGQPAKK